MKAFLVVALCLVASAFADFDYAGSTILGSTWNRPNWAYNDQQVLTCADSSPAANVQYQRFNASATGLTFWRILGAFEKDFRSYAEVLVYDATTFNPTTPCTGLLLAISSQSAAPPVDEYITANTGVYTIVISSDTVNQTGLFAINAIVAELTADNRNTTYQAAPIISSETTDCSDVSSTPVNIRTFSWSTNNTGAYDITVVAVWNTTASTTFYPTVAIFEGMFPNTTVNGTVLSFCDNGRFVYGGEGSSDGTLFLQSVNFTAGTIYTFAISAYDVDEIGDFGFFIEPTRWGNTETQPQTYNAPDVPATSTVANCTQSGTLKKYQNVVFEATNPVYIIDTSNGIDAATFLYEGVFTDAPPADCTGFIFGGDTGDGGPIAVVLTPGRNYTAVVTGYSSGAGQYSLYVMTGNPLGVPVTTTTGVPATTGDSGATTAVASMLLVVIAAFLAMF